MSDIQVEDFLEHYGVKGMKWGVRKDTRSTGYRLQTSKPAVDSSLQTSTKAEATEVASLIQSRYGFQTTAIKDLKTGNPAEYAMGTIGFVKSTPGQIGGEIYISPDNVSKELKQAEDSGWFAKGTGNMRAFVTHESAHAMFHAEQSVKSGFLKTKIVGGEIEARDKALKASVDEAKKAGISIGEFPGKVSGYASASGMREEVEAELFSQYHWSPNPPKFVKTWGETLHKELGVDSTPFRKVTKRE